MSLLCHAKHPCRSAFSAVGCPYSDINVNKDSVLPDRLSGEMSGSGSMAARPRRVDGSPDTAGGVTE